MALWLLWFAVWYFATYSKPNHANFNICVVLYAFHFCKQMYLTDLVLHDRIVLFNDRHHIHKKYILNTYIFYTLYGIICLYLYSL